MSMLKGAGFGMSLGAAYEKAKIEVQNPHRIVERTTLIFGDGTKQITEIRANGQSVNRIVKLNLAERVRYQGGEKIKEMVENFQDGAKKFVSEKLGVLQEQRGSMVDKVRGFFHSEDLESEPDNIADDAGKETLDLSIKMNEDMPDDLASLNFETEREDRK